MYKCWDVNKGKEEMVDTVGVVYLGLRGFLYRFVYIFLKVNLNIMVKRSEKLRWLGLNIFLSTRKQEEVMIQQYLL